MNDHKEAPTTNSNEVQPPLPGKSELIDIIYCLFIEGVVIPDFLSSMNAEPDPDGESFEELFERFASMRGTYIHYSPSTLHELLTLYH